MSWVGAIIQIRDKLLTILDGTTPAVVQMQAQPTIDIGKVQITDDGTNVNAADHPLYVQQSTSANFAKETGGNLAAIHTDLGTTIHDDLGKLTDGTQIAKQPTTTAAASTAFAASKVLKASACTFYSASCEIDPTAPTGTYYVILCDSTTIPGDGAFSAGVYKDSVGVEHQQGVRDYVKMTEPQGGLTMTSGATVALSTTFATMTAGGSYLKVGGRTS